MEKRFPIAVALSALVLLVYFLYFAPKSPPPPGPSPESSASRPSSQESQSAESKKREDKPATSLPAEPLPAAQISPIDTSLYEAHLSSNGGVIKDFIVKGFRETAEKNSPLVNLFKGTGDHNLILRFHEANFSIPEILPFEVSQKGPDFVEYRWKGPDLTLTKRFAWDSKNYSASVRITLENLSSQSLQLAPGLGLEAAQHPASQKGWGFLKAPENYIHPLLFQDKGISRQSDIKKLPSKSEEVGPFHWLGLEDRYFLWAIISRSLSADTRAEYGWKEGNILYSELIYPKEIVAPNGKMEKEFSVYVGPKDMDHLKSMGVGLEKSVDYGWFSIVAVFLLWLLKLFHSVVGNWGLAIIILTVFVKLLLHPINKKTLESMKAMQKLQPKLNEIREKYQNDRERMNLEMMNLFKTHKVNPMGGCLPMILQMPVYIALYKVLYNAIELYHAPFFGFYRDLSAPDPYFISPILLGIFMVFQQKMTPSATQDKAQANMMLIMPIMFSAFMLFLPSGLVIYIFVNTLMTVVQQYLHQHEMSFADLVRRGKKAS